MTIEACYILQLQFQFFLSLVKVFFANYKKLEYCRLMKKHRTNTPSNFYRNGGGQTEEKDYQAVTLT